MRRARLFDMLGKKFIDWPAVEARLAEMRPAYEAIRAELDVEYEKMKAAGFPEKRTILQGDRHNLFSALHAEYWDLVAILNLPGGRLHKTEPYRSPCLGHLLEHKK